MNEPTNYFHAIPRGGGRAHPENFFLFDGSDSNQQTAAFEAASLMVAASNGRVVVWRHPRFGLHDVPKIGEF